MSATTKLAEATTALDSDDLAGAYLKFQSAAALARQEGDLSLEAEAIASLLTLAVTIGNTAKQSGNVQTRIDFTQLPVMERRLKLIEARLRQTQSGGGDIAQVKFEYQRPTGSATSYTEDWCDC